MLFSPLSPTIRHRKAAMWSGVALGCTLVSVSAQSGEMTAINDILTNAASVHALSPEAAGQHFPVRLEGVVTHYQQRIADRFFFQDVTDGVYVRLYGVKPDVNVGDRVRIEGITEAGDYAPVLRLRRLEKLGRGELPPPQMVTATALATGRYDSRRVEVRDVTIRNSPALEGPP